MVFGIGRKDARDIQDAQEPAAVPYRVASYEHDHEGKRLRSSKVVYSFWSASKYVLILSLILWWLPMFGQMIAGYVGGRRAGGPWRGVAASILPVVCLYTVMTGFDSGFFPSHVMGVAIAPAAMSAALSESVPFVSPYIQFSSDYVGSFVDALAGASPYGINTYILTVAFAYVGGILAEQSRREIEFNSGAMMASTTVLVADPRHNPAQLQQAQHPYAQSRHGLAHIISSAFPWSKHEQGGYPQAFTSHHSHSSWARATPMRFDDGPEDGYASGAMLPPMGHGAREYSRATTRSRPTRTVRTHVKRGDPWQRADRRVKHTYTSARRFAEEPRPEPEFERGRSARPQHRIVPGDARSVKKAKRIIDSDWGHKRYPTLEDRPVRRVRAPEADDVPEEQPHAHRAPRDSGNHWDSI